MIERQRHRTAVPGAFQFIQALCDTPNVVPKLEIGNSTTFVRSRRLASSHRGPMKQGVKDHHRTTQYVGGLSESNQSGKAPARLFLGEIGRVVAFFNTLERSRNAARLSKSDH